MTLDKRKIREAEITVKGQIVKVKIIESWNVIAYDAAYAGYGDDRSRIFDNEEAALTYAKGLEKNYGASVHYRFNIDFSGLSRQVWSYKETQ